MRNSILILKILFCFSIVLILHGKSYSNYVHGYVYKPYTCMTPPYTCWSNNFTYTGFVGKSCIVAPNGTVIPNKAGNYFWENDMFCQGLFINGECQGYTVDFSYFTNEPLIGGKIWFYGYIPPEHGIPPLNENVGTFIGVFNIPSNEWHFNGANLERWPKQTSISASIPPQQYPNPFGGPTYLTDVIITGINDPNYYFLIQRGEDASGIEDNTINWNTSININPNTANYTFTGLTQGKKYYFRSKMIVKFPNNIAPEQSTPFSDIREVIVSSEAQILGTSSITSGSNGSWTAIPYASNVPVQWRVKVGNGAWSNVLGNGKDFSYTMPNENIQVKATVGPVGGSWSISEVIKNVSCSNCLPTKDDIIKNDPEVMDNTLSQNYPNPFNPSTTIKFSLKKASNVTIKVYDISGKEIVSLLNDFKDAGYNSVLWNGLDKNGHEVSSGIYYYKITADEFVETKRMILIK